MESFYEKFHFHLQESALTRTAKSTVAPYKSKVLRSLPEAKLAESVKKQTEVTESKDFSHSGLSTVMHPYLMMSL